jgi:DNA-binding IclR family transcriptional regulator
MSIIITSKVIKHTTAKGLQKFILLYLAECADERGFVCVPNSQVAAWTGFSVSTVRRALQKMCDSGLLEKNLRKVIKF